MCRALALDGRKKTRARHIGKTDGMPLASHGMGRSALLSQALPLSARRSEVCEGCHATFPYGSNAQATTAVMIALSENFTKLIRAKRDINDQMGVTRCHVRARARPAPNNYDGTSVPETEGNTAI